MDFVVVVEDDFEYEFRGVRKEEVFVYFKVTSQLRKSTKILSQGNRFLGR
jgi:hypothetical protein